MPSYGVPFYKGPRTVPIKPLTIPEHAKEVMQRKEAVYAALAGALQGVVFLPAITCTCGEPVKFICGETLVQCRCERKWRLKIEVSEVVSRGGDE